MATLTPHPQQQFLTNYDDSFLRQLGISPVPQQDHFTPPERSESHPFADMSFNPEDDVSSEEGGDDRNDNDYVDAGESYTPLSTSVPAPPQVPLHSRPAHLVFPNKSQPQPLLTQSTSQSHLQPPVANAQHRGQSSAVSRPIILPTPAPNVQKPRSRPARRGGVLSNPPLVASARPSNVKRVGAPCHRATLSVSSGSGPVDVIDPAVPDPNEEGIVMISPAQAHQLRFVDFTENMFLARNEFTDPMYPAHLEPPSKLSPLRCLCCKKQYNGPNARSMWRRHITQKHHFQLGGKKGNGKGRKGEDEDENTLPDEAAEELAARRREALLVQKREYARNRRTQERGSANGQPFFAETTDANRPNFLHPNAQWQPRMINGAWPTTLGAPVNPSAMQANFYIHNKSATSVPGSVYPPALQQIVVTDADEEPVLDGDEDEDAPLPLDSQDPLQASSSSSSSSLQSNILAPSPIISSPNIGVFGGLPYSPSHSLQQLPIQAEPQLVQNEEEVKPDASQPSGLNGRQALDFDIDLGALRTDYLATSPVMSSLQHDPASFFNTPGRSGADSLTEEERRRMILSLDSPTSFPLVKRSQTALGLDASPSASIPTQTSLSLKIPTRPSGSLSTPGFSRSRTMPAGALAGMLSSPHDGFSSLLRTTPGRHLGTCSSSGGIFDLLASPGYRGWGMNMDSPVVKRKRSVTDILDHPLSFVPWKEEDKDDADDGLLDPAAFDTWLDYAPNSPLKKVKSEDCGDDGRKAKKSRISI
ncbi:hypothetical protein FRB94_008703 [Tulasnella sp. JGI-2019a]|nr:hypothetical protein FRB94_008703 [Tulasnella sp. JGI-2019a]